MILSTIEYSKNDFEDLMCRLREFMEMEEIFRKHYQLEHKQLELSDDKKAIVEEKCKEFVKRYHDVLPDTPELFFKYGSVAVLKHLRYLPPHLHRHSFFEFFYVMEGSCVHISDGKKYVLKAGDFCLWQHNIPHQLIANNADCVAVNILVQKSAFEMSFFGNFSECNLLNTYFQKILYGEGDSPLLIFHTQGDTVLFELICSIYLEYEKREEFWLSAIISMLNCLFVRLLRSHQDHVTTSQNTDKEEPILAIIKYIQQQYADITLEGAADKFGYTPAYLSRYIKKKTGMTFSRIVIGQKMQHAATLLTTTQKSIGEIARDVNCSDASHFSRQFSKIYGVSPGEYRKGH